MLTADTITAVILAGGQGSRMGGVDKGLITLWEKPLVTHLVERLTPQVGSLLINANRHREQYQQWAPVIADNLAGFPGPLAGFEAGLNAAATDWIVVVPCDSPLLPLDLVERLATAISSPQQIAVVHDGEQLHAATALLHRSLLPSLQRYLARGDRKLRLWFAEHELVAVDFSDQASAFINLNTPACVEKLARRGHASS